MNEIRQPQHRRDYNPFEPSRAFCPGGWHPCPKHEPEQYACTEARHRRIVRLSEFRAREQRRRARHA